MGVYYSQLIAISLYYFFWSTLTFPQAHSTNSLYPMISNRASIEIKSKVQV